VRQRFDFPATFLAPKMLVRYLSLPGDEIKVL
jgi:hypothetical protein